MEISGLCWRFFKSSAFLQNNGTFFPKRGLVFQRTGRKNVRLNQNKPVLAIICSKPTKGIKPKI